MVARELVLRAHVDDAELLIFPSDKLSEKFQRKIFDYGTFGIFCRMFSSCLLGPGSRIS
jgi:hypothetical protein